MLHTLPAGFVRCVHIDGGHQFPQSVAVQLIDAHILVRRLNELLNVFVLSFLYFNFLSQSYALGLQLLLLRFIGQAQHIEALITQPSAGVVLVNPDEQPFQFSDAVFVPFQPFPSDADLLTAFQPELFLHHCTEMCLMPQNVARHSLNVFQDYVAEYGFPDVMSTALVLVLLMERTVKERALRSVIVRRPLIQLLTAVCSIGNDGVLLQPRYVKALTDENGKVVKEYETTEVRRVLSEETAAEMRDIMEYVVSDGGAGGAKVTGYRVGGKTGTANKVEEGKYGDNYYSSFIGMAPMDDPKVAILVVVDSPKGSFYGSLVACPIAKSILTDTLRYMNIEPQYTDEEKEAMESNYTTVPNIVGQEYSEAVGILAGKDLNCAQQEGAGESYVVAAQYPAAGTKVKVGSDVYAYSR